MSTGLQSPTLSSDVVDAYRRDGFVHIPGVLEADEVARYRDAALELANTMESQRYKGEPFTQLVNVWQQDERMAALTTNSRVAALAEALAGVPLRLWHDQVLIKQPKRSTATEFHFDAPYWPHTGAGNWLTAWIALVDVPVERGCMTFLPARIAPRRSPPSISRTRPPCSTRCRNSSGSRASPCRCEPAT